MLKIASNKLKQWGKFHYRTMERFIAAKGWSRQRGEVGVGVRWCRTYCNLDDNWNGKENEWNVLTMMTMRPTTATTPFECCNPVVTLPLPTPYYSYLRPAASAAIVVAVNATVKLSFCLTHPLPSCQHVLLLRRLFALKILFIAIARICTKIFYNAGQQHRDGWGVDRGGMPERG